MRLLPLTTIPCIRCSWMSRRPKEASYTYYFSLPSWRQPRSAATNAKALVTGMPSEPHRRVERTGGLAFQSPRGRSNAYNRIHTGRRNTKHCLVRACFLPARPSLFGRLERIVHLLTTLCVLP
jgi:hypothetical protein